LATIYKVRVSKPSAKYDQMKYDLPELILALTVNNTPLKKEEGQEMKKKAGKGQKRKL